MIYVDVIGCVNYPGGRKWRRGKALNIEMGIEA
jgi:hypothetical protein